MFTARKMALAIVSAMLSGCMLSTETPGAVDPDLARFSAMTLSAEEQARLSLVPEPDAAENDDVREAGADLITALFAPAPSTDDTPSQTYGSPVPYGEIARVCDAPRRPGTKIASGGGFTIYDSAPGQTGLRPHYVTGFEDNCARQFTAALALTGSAEMHEMIRYQASNKAGFNETDSAYEAIKASVCRVRHGKPCGGRMGSLARETIFVTAYESFGSRPKWVEILLHDGEVGAIDYKTR